MKFRIAIFSLAAGAVLLGRTAPTAQAEFSPAEIDHLIRAEWKNAGITPAPPVDDARFLRRVYIDITGAIPPPEAVTAFLADKSPYKRTEVVNQLLDSPKYVEHWTNYWDEILMGRRLKPEQVVDDYAFRKWLHDQFANNVPYNQFVYNLLTATGQNGSRGDAARMYGIKGGKLAQTTVVFKAKRLARMKAATEAAAPAPMETMQTANGAAPTMTANAAASPTMTTAAPQTGQTATMMAEEPALEPDRPINGAVNWTLKYRQTPADLGGTASRVFLGVQIQCAQCHDHKTEKWKQTDFRSFTSCFMQARPAIMDKGVQGFRRVDLEDVDATRQARRVRALANAGKNSKIANKLKENGYVEYATAAPAALDGTNFTDASNRRQALAQWMTADNNPWFAQEIVNRMWAYFLGRGFVDPIDDFRTTNPVVMPELLAKLADDFKANKYDLKYLIRTICATQAYQLSSAPAKNTDTGNTLWARYRLKALEPETMLDALVSATNMAPVLEKVSGNNLDGLKLQILKQLTFLFDVDEEFEQKEFDGTIPQALMLLNGNLVNSGATPIPGTALADTLAMGGDDDAKIESLYLRSLSRKPSMTELAYWRDFVNKPREVVTTDAPPEPQPARRVFRNADGQPLNAVQPVKAKLQMKRNNGIDPLARFRGRLTTANATPKEQAYEDMFWTLLNSSEFVFNH